MFTGRCLAVRGIVFEVFCVEKGEAGTLRLEASILTSRAIKAAPKGEQRLPPLHMSYVRKYPVPSRQALYIAKFSASDLFLTFGLADPICSKNLLMAWPESFSIAFMMEVGREVWVSAARGGVICS